MRLHYIPIFLLIGLATLIGCDEEDPEEHIFMTESGNIQGLVTDKETGKTLENASINIGDQITVTDSDGHYALEEIEFSENIDVTVNAVDYVEYRNTISLAQELMLFNIDLVPLISPSAKILDILEVISHGIESLDPDEIASMQACLSEDYAASDNAATQFGVLAGVIPPDHESFPETVHNIIDKYDKLKFSFIDPNVELTDDSASAWARFEVYAETKPPELQKWEIIVDTRFDFEKQDSDWKLLYWELVSDFIKFEWKPL